jgi:hypothetical protein
MKRSKGDTRYIEICCSSASIIYINRTLKAHATLLDTSSWSGGETCIVTTMKVCENSCLSGEVSLMVFLEDTRSRLKGYWLDIHRLENFFLGHEKSFWKVMWVSFLIVNEVLRDINVSRILLKNRIFTIFLSILS